MHVMQHVFLQLKTENRNDCTPHSDYNAPYLLREKRAELCPVSDVTSITDIYPVQSHIVARTAKY